MIRRIVSRHAFHIAAAARFLRWGWFVGLDLTPCTQICRLPTPWSGSRSWTLVRFWFFCTLFLMWLGRNGDRSTFNFPVWALIRRSHNASHQSPRLPRLARARAPRYRRPPPFIDNFRTHLAPLFQISQRFLLFLFLLYIYSTLFSNSWSILFRLICLLCYFSGSSWLIPPTTLLDGRNTFLTATDHTRGGVCCSRHLSFLACAGCRLILLHIFCGDFAANCSTWIILQLWIRRSNLSCQRLAPHGHLWSSLHLFEFFNV